jgi:hypothetical protein
MDASINRGKAPFALAERRSVDSAANERFCRLGNAE